MPRLFPPSLYSKGRCPIASRKKPSRSARREARERNLLQRLARDGRPPLQNLAIALGVLAAAALLGEVIYHLQFSSELIFVVYVLALFFISAQTDGYLYGLGATLVAVVLYNLLVPPPRFVFKFDATTTSTLLMMVAVSFFTSIFTGRIKRKAKVAAEKERRVELLYEIAHKLLAASDVRDITRDCCGFLVEYLSRSALMFSGAPEVPETFVLAAATEGDLTAQQMQAMGFAAANSAYTSGRPTGFGTGEFAECPLYCCPVRDENTSLGVIGISCIHGPLEAAELQFLGMITTQAALALRMENLARQQQNTEIAVQTEKSRNSLLRSISHDLRTPLTSILGVSAVLFKDPALDDATRKKLAQDIHTDAQWLLRMIENTLSVTRMRGQSTDPVRVTKTVEAAEEVVAEAASSVRKRFPAAHITISAPDELILVPMDAILIMQVLVNLIENAVRHAGRPDVAVTVGAHRQQGEVVFSVRDNGKGIGAEMMPHLFEAGTGGMRDSDDSRGLGMGLSICHTIVLAHGGRIWAENLPGGGASFHFTLPLLSTDL